MSVSFSPELKDGKDPKLFIDLTDGKKSVSLKLSPCMAEDLINALAVYLQTVDGLHPDDGYRIIE